MRVLYWIGFLILLGMAAGKPPTRSGRPYVYGQRSNLDGGGLRGSCRLVHGLPDGNETWCCDNIFAEHVRCVWTAYVQKSQPIHVEELRTSNVREIRNAEGVQQGSGSIDAGIMGTSLQFTWADINIGGTWTAMDMGGYLAIGVGASQQSSMMGMMKSGQTGVKINSKRSDNNNKRSTGDEDPAYDLSSVCCLNRRTESVLCCSRGKRPDHMDGGVCVAYKSSYGPTARY